MGELCARTIERLLDRHDLRVVGRLVEQADHRVEALIGMVDQDIFLADRREAVAVVISDTLGKARGKFRELKVGAIALGQELGIGKVQNTIHFDHFARRCTQGIEHEVEQRLGHVGQNLEPNDAAPAAAFEGGFEQLDQILGLFLNLDVAVTDDTKLTLADHVMAREEPAHKYQRPAA